MADDGRTRSAAVIGVLLVALGHGSPWSVAESTNNHFWGESEGDVRLESMRIKGFRSVGDRPVSMDFDQEVTALIGPNGAGKTVFLHALARLFGDERSLRTFVPSDYHVPARPTSPLEGARELWIEVDFSLPELADPDGDHSAVPANFNVMRLHDPDGVPHVRIRGTATLEPSGTSTLDLTYVLAVDADGEPARTAVMRSHDRAGVLLRYVPAQRNPSDHVSYAAGALVGQVLRAVDWTVQQAKVTDLSRQIADSLAGHDAVARTAALLTTHWSALHKGTFHSTAALTFLKDEVEGVLRHVSISMSPGHDRPAVDFSTMSDGQQSMFYLSLVMTVHALGRETLGDDSANPLLDRTKLRPPVHTILAVEEPENSLSPHHLGRILQSIRTMVKAGGAQAIVATHSPSVMSRIEPEQVRYLRLNDDRTTCVSKVMLPKQAGLAHKFVREGLRAFPEIYFARFVVLGEGDSEQIVLARCLATAGMDADATTVTIAPLGGRHVNHFWRLLNGLGIPHATLLDLDRGRHQAGWGRLKYAAGQLLEHRGGDSGIEAEDITELAAATGDVLDAAGGGPAWLSRLEKLGIFFSAPLDLDFAMLSAFPQSYESELGAGVERPIFDSAISTAVLGKKGSAEFYKPEELARFSSYHRLFQVGSKPVHHVAALADLRDEEMEANMPAPLRALSKHVNDKLKELPE